MSNDFKPDIWRLQAQFNSQGLVDALASDDAGIRRRAAAALRALGAVDAIPQLEAVLETEPDPEVRSNILSALATLRQEKERRESGDSAAPQQAEAVEKISEELQHLLNDLRSEDPETIIHTAHTLGDIGDKLAVEPLVILFNQQALPIKVRLAIAEALLKLESAPVEVALLGALRNPDWRIRRNSAAILGQLKAEWAVEPLIRSLTDKNKTVRRTAYAALRYIGTPEALKALIAIKQRAEARRRNQELQTDLNEDEAQAYLTKDDTQKIEWPKSNRDNPTLAPTKPLDPTVLERSEYYRRMQQIQNPVLDSSEVEQVILDDERATDEHERVEPDDQGDEQDN
ncbi:MAG: HEAT repeat domain-containing protein [Chloroflexota bacterium]